MNAGKSTALLQSNYNYHERGMETLLFLPKIDAEKNNGKIHSRIGLEADAVSVDSNFNFFSYVSQKQLSEIVMFCWKNACHSQTQPQICVQFQQMHIQMCSCRRQQNVGKRTQTLIIC